MIAGMTVTRGTRWIALVLTVLAVLVVTLTMVGTLVVTYEPWRFVAFTPFERQPRPALIIAAGMALLGVAGWLGLRNRTAVMWTSTASAGAVLMTLCVGGLADDTADVMAAVSSTDDLTGPVITVAKSPDGRFAVVARTGPGKVSRYRLRTTAWPLGRESQVDLACTATEPTRHVDGSTGSSSTNERVPSALLEQARFADGPHVELRMTDGRAWTVGFDAGSLRADRYLDWCDRLEQEPR